MMKLIFITMLATLELFAASYSANITAAGDVIGPLYLRPQESATYSLSSFGTATVLLQRSQPGSVSWETIGTFTADQSSTVYWNRTGQAQSIRFYASAYTSGTIAAALADVDGDVLKTYHFHPYQTGREIIQVNDLGQAVFPGGTRISSNDVVYQVFSTPDSTFRGFQFNEGTDTDGSSLVHRWTGTDSTSSFLWTMDGGVTQMQLYGNGRLDVGNGADQPIIELQNAAAGNGYLGLAANTGTIQLFAGPGTGTYFRIYGPSHATQANDWNINADGADVIVWDDSADQLNIAPASGAVRIQSTSIGFFNTTPATKPTVSGAHGSNAALQSLLTALENLGLITDSSS